LKATPGCDKLQHIGSTIAGFCTESFGRATHGMNTCGESEGQVT